jgi:molybdopterin synthase sulfur carrier subunit
MRVNVLYFASLRESLGLGAESLQTSALTIGELRSELMQRGCAYKEALSRDKIIRCALNQVMCAESDALVEDCEVAFFPPVTGG